MNDETPAEREVTFEEYAGSMYPRALACVETTVSQEQTPHLLNSALRLSYLLEMKKAKLPNDPSGEFLRVILTKCAQELYALHATVRVGSVYGSAHHARSLMETYAIVNYVGSVPTKRTRRLEKFTEFRLLAVYKHHTILTDALKAGKLTPEEFAMKYVAKPSDIAKVDEQMLDKWNKLYGRKDRDVTKIFNWHSPASIENLLEATRLESVFKDVYGHLCHLTHVSPLSTGFTGSSLMMQPGQFRHIDRFMSVALFAFWNTLSLVDEWIDSPFCEHFTSLFTHLKSSIGNEVQ